MKLALILTFALLVAAQCFTQSLAYQARYSSALGSPYYTRTLFHHPHSLYAPWQGLGWAWRWGWQAPRQVKVAATWALAPVLGMGVLMLGRRAGAVRSPQGRPGQPPPMTGHGTTAWATRRDVKKAGLL